MENEKNLNEEPTALRELTDENLEKVSGGKIEWAPVGAVPTGSGKKVSFYFNVGNRVEVSAGWFGTERGTIVERKVETKPYSPSDNSYPFDHDMPVYRIQFDKSSYREKYADKFWNQDCLSY